MTRAAAVGLLTPVVALALSACSGSSTPKPVPSSSTSQPPSTSSSPAPSTSAPASSSASAAPLSAFENDPGVKAFRAWAIEAAKTINAGHDDSAALNALMTASFAKSMNDVLGGAVGYRALGPIPFQPLSVTVTDSTHRLIKGCLMATGFTVDKKTNKQTKVVVLPRDIYTVEQNGRWLMNNLDSTTAFSCAGVTVRAQKW